MVRCLVSAALVLATAATALAQQVPPTGDHQRANESFFGPLMFLLILVPIVITAVLAIKRGKKRYYAKSSLRRKIKSGVKRRGGGRKCQRRAAKSGWA